MTYNLFSKYIKFKHLYSTFIYLTKMYLRNDIIFIYPIMNIVDTDMLSLINFVEYKIFSKNYSILLY